MTPKQTSISFLKWYRVQVDLFPKLAKFTPTEVYEIYHKERQARLAETRETHDQSAAEDHLDYLESKW